MDADADRVRVSLVPGLTPRAVAGLRERYGRADLGLGAPAAELAAVPGVGPVLAARLAAPPSLGDARREIRRAERIGAVLLHPDHDEYPARLLTIPDPPETLYLLGRGRPAREGVAVVGARRASVYGRIQGERFGAGLARAGLVVVSGLARGVDAVAHRGALSAGGVTVAVLGSGIDRVYPPEHRGLAREIAADGLLMTEFPLGTEPRAHHFPQRNRLIAGVSGAVVVVEGKVRSGSLITARLAADFGRLVFAVPGRVDTDLSAGPHSLVREGAVLATGPEEVIADLGYAAPDAGPVPDAPPADPLQAAILDVLDPSEPRGVETILERTGASAPATLAALLALELSGRVIAVSGRRYVRKPVGSPRARPGAPG